MPCCVRWWLMVVVCSRCGVVVALVGWSCRGRVPEAVVTGLLVKLLFVGVSCSDWCPLPGVPCGWMPYRCPDIAGDPLVRLRLTAYDSQWAGSANVEVGGGCGCPRGQMALPVVAIRCSSELAHQPSRCRLVVSVEVCCKGQEGRVQATCSALWQFAPHPCALDVPAGDALDLLVGTQPQPWSCSGRGCRLRRRCLCRRLCRCCSGGRLGRHLLRLTGAFGQSLEVAVIVSAKRMICANTSPGAGGGLG